MAFLIFLQFPRNCSPFSKLQSFFSSITWNLTGFPTIFPIIIIFLNNFFQLNDFLDFFLNLTIYYDNKLGKLFRHFSNSHYFFLSIFSNLTIFRHFMNFNDFFRQLFQTERIFPFFFNYNNFQEIQKNYFIKFNGFPEIFLTLTIFPTILSNSAIFSSIFPSIIIFLISFSTLTFFQHFYYFKGLSYLLFQTQRIFLLFFQL